MKYFILIRYLYPRSPGILGTQISEADVTLNKLGTKADKLGLTHSNKRHVHHKARSRISRPKISARDQDRSSITQLKIGNVLN